VRVHSNFGQYVSQYFAASCGRSSFAIVAQMRKPPTDAWSKRVPAGEALPQLRQARLRYVNGNVSGGGLGHTVAGGPMTDNGLGRVVC
jgi:hypothetical protein